MTLLLLLGTWPIALILLTALFFTVRFGLKQSKSGATTGSGSMADPIRRWRSNMPFLKTQGGVYSAILAVVIVAYFIWLATSK